MGQPPVLTSPNPLSTLQKQFACARLSRPCLPGSSSRLFCNVHHPRLYGLSIVKRFFVRPGNPVSSPRPAVLQSRARAGAVKVGRHTNLSTNFELARPYLDSSEHGGTLDAIGITIRGEPAFRARRSIAPHPCIQWGPRPRTMMQSYASAAKLRGGGPFFFSAQKP